MKKLDILLDTDVGGDCDDMMALAYTVYASRYLGVSVRSVTHSQGCENGAALIRTFFRELGEPVPLLGTAVEPARAYDYYCKTVLERFSVPEDYAEYPDAVTAMRKALTESDDAVLCAIGPLANIAALLSSKGDDVSPLDGKTLIKEKCAKLVLMAGDFRDGADREWNIFVDPGAARKVVEECPVPIVFLPFDTGLDIFTGSELVQKLGETTPLTLSFLHYPGLDPAEGRHSWDPATMLYAVEGCGEFFEESEPGTAQVDETGVTRFIPNAEGMHRILKIKPHAGKTERECKDAVAAYIDSCVKKIYVAQ